MKIYTLVNSIRAKASNWSKTPSDITRQNVVCQNCLNSMWEKLTERSNRTQTKLISESHELYIFLVTPGIEVQNMMFASDDVVWISWQSSSEERVPSLRHTNEVIGAYVTAGPRIHLYSYLDRLQDRAIYCDTDSVIFIQPTAEPALVETGTIWGR